MSELRIVRPTRWVLVLLAIAIVAPSRSADACACCTTPGTWSQTTRAFTPEELAEIGRVNLGTEAQVFLTAAGPPGIPGLDPAAMTYALRHHRPGRTWSLQLTDTAGRSGSLTFEIPDTATFFAADMQNGDLLAPSQPLLYKSWTVTGRALGEGPVVGGPYRLVLQGRGNACPNAGHFQSWSLQITTGSAAYSLYGSLAPPTPSSGAATAAYFVSPAASVDAITELLRRDDWATLARYYDLSGTDVVRQDLESGRYFVNARRPEGMPAWMPWRYAHPFAPGYRFQTAEATDEADVIRVIVALDIDQGRGPAQRVLSSFFLRRSSSGYQLLPRDP